MKKDRTRLIIGILMSLVLFSSFTGLWFYTKDKKMQKQQNESVYVFVLSRDIPKNHRITTDDLRLEAYPKSAVKWRVLSKNEILHKYAKTPLYRGEPLIPNKLSDAPIEEKKVVVSKEPVVKNLQPKENNETQLHDVATFSLSLFHNIDPTLKSGDHIDIVTVDLKNQNRMNNSFTTKYIAISVPVISFSSNNIRQNAYIATKYVDEKQTLTTTADSITLQLTPRNVKNLLALYYKTLQLNAKRPYNDANKGHLWIIKTAKKIDEKELKQKEHLLVDYKAPRKRKVYKRKKEPGVRIDYED